MSEKETFISTMQQGYTFEGPALILGGAMYQGECMTHSYVQVPLKMLNRHGLIAGATGSGKTKTLQILAEQLSLEGIPSLLMDVKGDLSGIAAASAGHPKIDERHARIGIPFQAGASPVDFLSLSSEKGARLRATLTEFGPILFSKMLGLNDTQAGVVAVIYKYCDDTNLPLLNLADFKKVLQFITAEGKVEMEREYGRISTTSTGAILRKIIELEQQGADQFFGEPSFDVDDLCRTDASGKGMVSIIRLTDIQDKPKLFSSFMLQLLAEVYATFPEAGDLQKPKLIIFIDEAHLIFQEASDALLDQIEVIVKLIRSKGVGLFFVTQNPADIPDDVLGQLGLKIQHALRAFTAKDRKAIKLAAQNYPDSTFYAVDELITQLGIGEALVTALNEKGIPTPLAHTLLRAPQSRMDVLTPQEIDAIIARSHMIPKYNRTIDSRSAHDILTEKLEEARQETFQEEIRNQRETARKTSTRKEKTVFDQVMSNPTTKQIGRTVARELTRGLLGVLGLSSTSRRSRSSSSSRRKR
ncbi:MAG TPA: DUF853 family protein [Saprospiraceae bacterium]|nr:DUF853 family protein [Saprospiraceae bacterium]HMQ81842.1 DUF853 family protein [Saprospiraceae bacterium]